MYPKYLPRFLKSRIIQFTIKSTHQSHTSHPVAGIKGFFRLHAKFKEKLISVLTNMRNHGSISSALPLYPVRIPKKIFSFHSKIFPINFLNINYTHYRISTLFKYHSDYPRAFHPLLFKSNIPVKNSPLLIAEMSGNTNSPLPLRRLINTPQAVNEAAVSWSTSLLGNFFPPSVLNYPEIKREVSLLWKQNQNFQIQTMGPNLFIFKLPTVEAQSDILKRGPWVVLGHLLAIQKYNPAIQVKDHSFTHQTWCVKLRGISVVHLCEEVLREILVDIGKKVAFEDGYRLPRGSLLTTCLVEIPLKEPLKRGGWIYTTSGEKKWVIYHYDKQPRNICKKCFVIYHNEEKCKVIEKKFFIERLTDEEYGSWSITEEGKETLAFLGQLGFIEVPMDQDDIIREDNNQMNEEMEDANMETNNRKRLRNGKENENQESNLEEENLGNTNQITTTEQGIFSQQQASATNQA